MFSMDFIPMFPSSPSIHTLAFEGDERKRREGERKVLKGGKGRRKGEQ